MLQADQLYQMGNRHYREGNLAVAISNFEAALRIFPKHVYAWSNLGTCYRETGRLNDSLTALTRALELWPRGKVSPNCRVMKRAIYPTDHDGHVLRRTIISE
jgi:Flp pilus assembly protein TadD